MADGVMAKICGPCPYARPPKMLQLHPERAEEFAYSAQNPYSDFVCHKTAVHSEWDDEAGSELVRGQRSLTCRGFWSLQNSENGTGETDPEAFDDIHEMIDTHEEGWGR